MDAIVAVYSDWGIGAAGTQPLVIPADRKRFAELTRGAAVIVGRKTLEDFPGGKPLKGRVNIVLTRREMSAEGVIVAPTVEAALEEAEKHAKVFVLGGESIFSQMFPHLTRVFVTKINAAPHSDSHFPNLDANPNWKCTDAGTPEAYNGVEYRFTVYERV